MRRTVTNRTTFNTRRVLSPGKCWCFTACLFVGACADDPCCLETNQVVATVAGTVTDASGAPVAGAEIRPLGALLLGCSEMTIHFGTSPLPAVSESDGSYEVGFGTTEQAGEHCLDIRVDVPTAGFSDTIRSVRVDFRPPEATSDPVVLHIVVRSP